MGPEEGREARLACGHVPLRRAGWVAAARPLPGLWRAGAWPCCPRCLPPDPGDVGPWPLAADPEVALWALGPYRDALRAAVLAGKLDDQPAALTELGRPRRPPGSAPTW